jgi:hypothetical protein
MRGCQHTSEHTVFLSVFLNVVPPEDDALRHRNMLGFYKGV